MQFIHRSFLSAMLLAMCSLAAAQSVQQPLPASQLAEPGARISDGVIFKDYQVYNALQERIHQINEHGVPVRDYRLSKAQCWLDVSLHEYTRNDRSDFPQAAMTEAEKLIVSLEQGDSATPLDTPLVNGAARLRPDLWARTDALRQAANAQCGGQQIACAEVELVHAGNEFNQQGWRHAKPYIQIAEDLLGGASAAMASCPPSPAQAQAGAQPTAIAPLASVPTLPDPEAVELTVQLLFDFDQSSPAHIRPSSMEKFRAVVARVRAEKLVLSSVDLVGYADHLNGTGRNDYNQQLSRKRVETVQAMLQAYGLVASEVRTDARGDEGALVPCQLQFSRRAELQECLLPNRRVEVHIKAIRSTEVH